MKDLRRIHELKKRYGYKYDPHDILRFNDNYTMIKVISVTTAAGIIGGMVGIAGGTVLGPVLLQLGLLPTVVASTN